MTLTKGYKINIFCDRLCMFIAFTTKNLHKVLFCVRMIGVDLYTIMKYYLLGKQYLDNITVGMLGIKAPLADILN